VLKFPAGRRATTNLAARQVRRHHRIKVIGATGAPQNRSTTDRRECAGCGPPLPDRSALYGVLAETEGLGLNVLEVCQLTRTANHQDQVTPAHRDGR
jgi:hypothetical protein